jgi:broad specificity phosphatase PhoE
MSTTRLLCAGIIRGGVRVLLAIMLAGVLPAAADQTPWNELRSGGHVLLMRHAETDPGVGDPPGFRIGDCSTQRNLSAAGRLQSRRIGERFTGNGIPVAGVLSSRWCRCLETARLAFGKVVPEPALDSFFADRRSSDEQTAAVRARIQAFRGPGNLVMVTHQVNITALTGKFPAPGEIFVVRAGAQGQPQWIGRLAPGD